MSSPLITDIPIVETSGPLVGTRPIISPLFTGMAVGKYVHYYPGAVSPEGEVAQITRVVSSTELDLSYAGSTVRSIRGGHRDTQPGQTGTWDPLDTRHKSRLRIHLVHATALAANLEATPALRDRYFTNGSHPSQLMDLDIIMTTPGTQQVEFASTLARLVALGFDCNYGFITVGGFFTDPETSGINSIWLNSSHWSMWRDYVEEYEEIGAGLLDGWIHCQMEAAPPPITQAYLSVLTNLGRTRAELAEAMSPYTNAIRATGKRTIVRPFGELEDCGLVEVLRAGSWGSIWCFEGNGFASKHHRRSEYEFAVDIGTTRHQWSVAGAYMPPGTFPNQFHYEGGLRMYGASSRAAPLEENQRFPIYELTYINEVNGAVNNPHVGKDIWYQCTSMNPFNANLPTGTGPLRPSMNDFYCSWFVYNDTTSVQVEIDRNHGTARGLPNQPIGSACVGLLPWKRTTASDAVENSRAWGTLGLTTPALVTNEAHGWYIAAEAVDSGTGGVAHASFSLSFDMILPSVAPASNVTWGICGQTQTNAHAWNLVWNGSSGNIELNVRDASGQDTFTYLSNPTPGSTIRVVIVYDRAQGSTGKWWTPGGWVTPDIVKNGALIAILIGGAHDLLNRTTTVWGIPGAVLPYSTYVLLSKRAWTDLEITCRRDADSGNKVPFGYGTFF